MEQADQRFLRDFFQKLARQELSGTDDELYVRIYDHPEVTSDDPVDLLARGIEWTPGGSVQLFSGFRGTGKSTELRRLMERLEDSGFLVVLYDVEDYVNLHTPVDVADFLIALAGGFGEALAKKGLLKGDPAQRSYWERFREFLTDTNVEIDGVSFEAGGVGLQAALKQDPSVKKKIQERMAGHLGALVEDVREYVKGLVLELKQAHAPDTELVLLVDSVEHIRGTSINAKDVQDSVERLFAGHPDKLHLPNLHVVYTVPPYLKVRYPGIGALYEPGGLRVLPAVKVRVRDGGDRFSPGLGVLEEVVRKRGDWERLLDDRDILDRLSLASGGHLRDLLRILAEIVRRAQRLPASEETIDAALNQVRGEMLPIPDDDVRWLDRVARSHEASLRNRDHLPDFARYLDTHLVLGYRNGGEWYDVHPLIAEHVGQQAAALADVDDGAESSDGEA